MNQHPSSPSAEEARDLLAKAEGIGSTATSAAGWPTAMVFNALAIIGSMMMIGFQTVAHTGYGAPLLATSVGVWAAITSLTWTFMQRTTKAGYSKRFATSLFAYMALYVVAVLVGAIGFPHGNLAYYISAAVVLAAVGVAAAFRELRA
ncbi:hypothetical protein [Arthrobacter sp. HY1533]|uniref:hypothetical protein n=1 Tax=Arthrobacter sp. HY1533 TaxID=2970919 RepID=UPI0022B9E26A|nr:hypothetical protein [Arthrobacter sp. HY1533]